MSEEKQIFTQLAKIALEIGAIGKQGQNTQQNYSYRRLEDVINEVHRAFASHGIVLTSQVIDKSREEKTSKSGTILNYSILTMTFTFYASDGSFVQSTTVGEGMDSGDKSSNKAMSAALKYALGQTLMIPFDVIDSEIDSHDIGADAEDIAKWTKTLTSAGTVAALESAGKALGQSNVSANARTKLREVFAERMSKLQGAV